VFSAFLSPRAASATPEERLGASTEHPSRGVRPSSIGQGLGLPISFSRLRLSSLHAAARGFAAVHLPMDDLLVPLLPDASQHHAGDRAIPLLSTSWEWAPFIPQGTRRFTAHGRSQVGHQDVNSTDVRAVEAEVGTSRLFSPALPGSSPPDFAVLLLLLLPRSCPPVPLSVTRIPN
jgi:hypothetical protein